MQMTMKKKIYQSPRLKERKLRQTRIICASTSSNESYEYGTTDNWYNQSNQ